MGERLLLADLGEKLDRFRDRQRQHIMNRFAMQLHPEDVRLKAATFALGAAHIEIAQKLHLDFLKPGAAATLATATAGVEGKGTSRQPLRHGFRLGRK